MASYHRAKGIKALNEQMTPDNHAGILVASECGIAILSVGDIADAVAACIGRYGLLATEQDLSTDFFDLRSGLAGEVFQKFITYRIRLAIVVPDPGRYGERFSELAYEHWNHDQVRLVRSREEAIEWLQSEGQTAAR